MIKDNIQIFADWCFENKDIKETKYFSNLFKNDTNLFTQLIYQWADIFENSYGYNPFDKNYQSVTFSFIEDLQNNLKDNNAVYEIEKLSTDFVTIERIIKNNYIVFLASKLYGEDLELYTNTQKSLKLDAEVPFGKEFLIWLEKDSGLTKGSAISYLSYVKNLNEKIILTKEKPNFFFHSIKFLHEDNNLDSLNKLLNISLDLIDKSSDKEMINKYKSALVKYRDFLVQNRVEE